MKAVVIAINVRVGGAIEILFTREEVVSIFIPDVDDIDGIAAV